MGSQPKAQAPAVEQVKGSFNDCKLKTRGPGTFQFDLAPLENSQCTEHSSSSENPKMTMRGTRVFDPLMAHCAVLPFLNWRVIFLFGRWIVVRGKEEEQPSPVLRKDTIQTMKNH